MMGEDGVHTSQVLYLMMKMGEAHDWKLKLWAVGFGRGRWGKEMVEVQRHSTDTCDDDSILIQTVVWANMVT